MLVMLVSVGRSSGGCTVVGRNSSSLLHSSLIRTRPARRPCIFGLVSFCPPRDPRSKHGDPSFPKSILL